MTSPDEQTSQIIPQRGSETRTKGNRAANKIVVDTTVIIAVLINESSKERILDLTLNTILVAPASLDLEIGNAFSRMFKRKRLDLSTAKKAIGAYLQIPIELRTVDLASAVKLSHSLDIYAYDAYVIDCARQLGAPLLSLDGGLVEAGRRADVKIIEVE